MISLDATLEGVEPALARLRQFGVDVLGVIEPPLLRMGYRVENQMKEYPPQRPTNYVRTGKYGQAWFTDPVIRSGDQVRLNQGNKIEYAPYVGSEERQAWMHRGHWPTDEEALNEELPRGVEEFRGAILRVADALGRT